MAKGRLHFDGDNVGIEKEARIYSLTDDVERKINSIPNVIDNTSSTSATDALSANMGRDLQEQINNLASRGRYLSTWNAEIGLPDTNPQVSPYVYRAGDYYIVSKVVSGTNYRPHGSSYVTGEASTDVETESISVNDLYIYDGAQWIRQGSGSGATTTWGSIVGILSNQTDLQSALDDKQDELTAGEGISIDANNVISNTLPGVIVDSTAPSNPAQGDLWYDTTNNKLKTFDGTNWNETGVTYVAGDNIQINGTTISATDTKYSAGRNVTIGGNVINARDTEYEAGSNIAIACPTESDMKGPAPSGFHVPLKSEWEAICNIIGNALGLSVGKATFETYLLMPTAGIRFSNLYFSDFYFGYWTSTRADDGKARFLDEHRVTTGGYPQVSNAYAIRTFKNTPVVPDNNWATLYDGSSVAANAGIFYSSTDGLISISGDGTTWYTIQDKNLGATVVYHSGDVLSDANCGALYQWGNNYAFSRSNTPSKQNPTAISASGYGPGNYYTSDTYGTARPTRDNSGNGNLRGGQTQGTWQDCEHPIISATGGATYTAGTGIDITNNEISADTTVLATQTDLNSKQDKLTAGDNITIGDAYTTESDMKGPAPDGFHVPLITEWEGLKTIMDGLSLTTGTDWRENLRIPSAGIRNRTDAATGGAGGFGSYWSSSPMSSPYNAHYLYISGADVSLIYEGTRTFGYSIRCFKDSYVVPTSSWTVVQGTLGNAGIFRNQTEGLISITSDGTTGYTIADKNLGATTVWNSGDTLSEANCGKYYQRGNNYGFPFTGNVSTSSTQVDTTGYGPGNYYTGADFIVGIPGSTYDWSNPSNDNLRGGVTQGTWQDCIHNVISSTDTTYTAGNGIDIDQNDEISIDTTVVATQADIANFFDKTSDDADDIDDTNSTNKFVTATEKSTWNGKQDAIQDLSTIRSNATAGAGAATTIAGYGDIVSHDASEFATSAQGTKADTALQSGDNISELTNDAGYITNAYHDSTKQDTLIAGTNVQIDTNTNTISATDTTYTAGTGLGLSGTQFSVDSTVVALQSDLANYYTTSQTYSKTEVDNLISSFGSFTVVDTLPAASSADEKTIYLLGPIGSGADKYEEWIITRGAGNWASTTTMYPFTVNKNAWDGAIFIDSQTSPLSDFRGDCYVGAKLTSIGDETKLPVKLSFRADSSVDSEWVGLNEPAFAYNPDQYPNGDDLDIYIPNTSSSNSVSITAEGVMSSSPITWELGPKQWTKIGEASVDLTNYLNTSTQTSDVITEGSTNLFLTSAERTKIANSITGMTILSYGNSTWQDFIDAYSNNRVVYCRASSNSDPSTGSQGRLAFMAYVNNASNPTEVEFQYYRSRSSHSTAANVLDEVYVYKLVPSNGGTWTVTQRDTAAKPIAGTGIGLTYNASGMTISADTTTLATKTDLNSKQDTLVSGTNIKTVNNESLLGTGNITISAPTYTAGDNVQISSSNVISATDTKYNAGEGISIGNVTKNGRQGPSPKGFHVPSATEWQGVKTIMDGLSLTDGNDWKTNLHMPYAGIRVYGDAAINFQGNGGYYWASTPHETSAGNRLSIGSGFARTDGYDWRSNANSIRSFKDSYETPDSNWTVIQGTLGSTGIFWNQSEGLISITDGTTGYTIMDKNLGATVVYNNGNTLSQANMGNLYQWGNNYGFPSTGTITNTSSTQVDASGYGPTNPYSSETYIIGSTDWSSVQNDDLWGDTTGTYTQENVISNTVINSIQSSGPINVKKIWAGTTAQYNALSTYDADTIYIKVD